MARRNRNSRRNEAAPGWVWMLFGLGLGLIVAIGVYLRSPAGSEITETRAAAAALPTTSRAAPAAPKQAEEPPQQRAAGEENRFEFYEVLPQFEVVVPENNGSAAAPVTTRARPAAVPGSFLLQAGSFSAAADADRLKANLALLGFESHVQRVTIEDDVFNRVRIGPIADLDTAKRTQRRLRDAGIDALLMKVPN